MASKHSFLLVLGLLAAGCSVEEKNASLVKDITGPVAGRTQWLDTSDTTLASGDRSAFGILNPGYELQARGLFTYKVDGQNHPDWVSNNKYEITIVKTATKAVVASQEIKLKQIFGLPSDESDCAKVRKEDRDFFVGIFANDALVGRLPQGSGHALCVDDWTGEKAQKICTEDNVLMTVHACTIPGIAANGTISKVIVLK